MQVRIGLTILILSLGMGGCEAREENSSEDQARAREVLLAALDAWKSDKLPSLAKRDPPVRFADDDQRAGMRLQSYQLSDPNSPIHPFRDVSVTLTLQDRSGRSSQKPVTYQVSLEPSVSVLRSDN